MGVNKVVYGDNTLIDLTGDTVTAAKMLSGTTAHDKSGTKVTGTIATKTASNMTASGATVTAPAGYYASAASKSVATATQATPSISVDSAGKITASATQTAGYVSAGTKSATKQLTTQSAQTITPGTSDQTIAAGKYLTGAQTIKGDANLVPENIVEGVSIFGVEGEAVTGGGGGDFAAITITNNSYRSIVINNTFIESEGGSKNVPLTNDWTEKLMIVIKNQWTDPDYNVEGTFIRVHVMGYSDWYEEDVDYVYECRVKHLDDYDSYAFADMYDYRVCPGYSIVITADWI